MWLMNIVTNSPHGILVSEMFTRCSKLLEPLLETLQDIQSYVRLAVDSELSVEPHNIVDTVTAARLTIPVHKIVPVSKLQDTVYGARSKCDEGSSISDSFQRCSLASPLSAQLPSKCEEEEEGYCILGDEELQSEGTVIEDDGDCLGR